jgi:hypothetical protein
MRMHNPPHPGKIVREFLGEIDMTTAARRQQASQRQQPRIEPFHCAA